MEDTVYQYTVSLAAICCETGFSESLVVNRDTLDKLIQNSPKSGTFSNSLPAGKDMPPPLDPKNYPDVQFWTAKSFERFSGNLVGETDGLATRQKKHGRRRRSSEGKDRHPYLETMDGGQISREMLIKVGQKARRLWQALSTAGLAPSSWGKASEVAYTYFNSEMLNEPEFEFFRYCEGNWKITRWTTKAYASWKCNHLQVGSNEADNRKTHTGKRKRELLDDPTLLQIGDELASENTTPSTSGCTAAPETRKLSSPIQFNSDVTQVRPSPSHGSAPCRSQAGFTSLAVSSRPSHLRIPCMSTLHTFSSF